MTENGDLGEVRIGNTNNPHPSENKDISLKNKKKKGTSRTNQLLNWCFTFNNYNEKDIDILLETFKLLKVKKYVFQEETGKDGTKHLQGVICLEKAMRWSEFNLDKGIHWEKTKNLKASLDYCQKEDTRTGNIYKFGFPPECRVINILRPWQFQIVEYIKNEIHDRQIFWIYDKIGNNGKTALSKYLIKNHNCICATSGGVKDIANLLTNLFKDGRDLNEKTTFLFSFSRTTEGISYKAIESVKDGLITNIKYEAATMIFNIPHVIVLCNFYPDKKKLSDDRWNIKKIENDKLIEGNINDFEN